MQEWGPEKLSTLAGQACGWPGTGRLTSLRHPFPQEQESVLLSGERQPPGLSCSGGPTQESAGDSQRLTDPGPEERAHLPSGGLGEAGSPGAPPVPPGQVHRCVSFSVSPRAPLEALPGGKHHHCGLLHGPSSGPHSVGNSDFEARDPRSLGKERPAGGGHVGGLTAVLSFLFPPMSSRP